MSWFRRLLALLVITASGLIGIALFEVSYLLLKPTSSPYKWDKRYMLFGEESGLVFKNNEKFFVYEQNKHIRSKTYYDIDDKWIIEYDYIIPTNNLGLVQSSQVIEQKQSVLLLGNSYTEGQGSHPWVDALEESLQNSPYQYINGGILGTGPMQWKLLHDHLLTKQVKIEKLIVLFISQDYVRGVFNFSEKILTCIRDSSMCNGDENFYGLPSNHEINFLDRLKEYREKRSTNDQSSVIRALKLAAPATYSAYKYLSTIIRNQISTDVESIHLVERAEIDNNRLAVKFFIELYGDNVLFIHLPAKDEIFRHNMNPTGKAFREDIAQFGGQFLDGFVECGLTVQDYFANDGHPNANGYTKIAKCTADGIRRTWRL